MIATGLPKIGPGDAAALAAGTLVLIAFLGARLSGRDPFGKTPGPPPKVREVDALAGLLGAILAQILAGMAAYALGARDRAILACTGTAASAAVALAAAWAWLRNAGPSGPPGRAAMAGVLAFLGSFPLVMGVLLATRAAWSAFGREFPEQPILETLRRNLALFFTVAVVLAPLAEEIVFRGLLFSAFRRRLGAPIAALASTAAWTAVHQHLPTAPAIFALGLCLCFVYVKSGSLWGPLAFHAAFNGWQFLGAVLGGD